MKKYEAKIAQEELEEKQATARHVFMTSKGDDAGQGATDLPSQVAQDVEAAREQSNRLQPLIHPMKGCQRFKVDQDHSSLPSPSNIALKTS
jgi:hypothetical protein